MPYNITFHYNNSRAFQDPHLWVWYTGYTEADDLSPTGQDGFGLVYNAVVKRPEFGFKFKEGAGTSGPWEPPGLDRVYRPLKESRDNDVLHDVWCVGEKAFVYYFRPKDPELISAQEFLQQLAFTSGVYLPNTGGLSGLGATPLTDGRHLFGFYHPNAARVYLMGSFNDWQRPGHDRPDESQFIEMDLYRGYFGVPNIWLAVTDNAKIGDEYKFCVLGGVPSDEKRRFRQYFTDPYARQLGKDFGFNNSVVVDPTSFQQGVDGWVTPDMGDLIIYELSVYGFTEGDPDIQPGNHGKFKGITERIRSGYFNQLGITALSLMPLAEVPSLQGPNSLGYDPSLFFTVERDFGTPDDLKELVDAAHQQGLAVMLDQVFNHTSNDFNPLWKMIIEHPDEEFRQEGGLYFSGTTPWGNRIDTAKEDVQNILIDACKLLLTEYHVDGFRLDATHHNDFMEFSFLDRLARELKESKPDVLLIAENLPNQSDLNRQGFDGYAQWCNLFHDKIKALLREGQFEGENYNEDKIGQMFYFSKESYASHTNNVVNYCESHDETSVPFEVATDWVLNHQAAKDRKGRLGLLSTVVALGQPMIYMGQEFNVERDRNHVQFDWPHPVTSNGFFQWTSRLIRLRKRYPGLKLRGYNPADDGRFIWIVSPWLPANRGGGRKVIGWRSCPNQLAHEALVVMLNFENHQVVLDVDFGIPGIWVKLADIDQVNDIPPEGTNSVSDPAAIVTEDGAFHGFTLPSSSGFVYKWESSL